MIDLIIPHYNNKEGLMRTLNSVDTNIFQITIMDDCSNVFYAEDLEQIRQYGEFVSSPADIQFGPGIMRQDGIYYTSNDYLMFIDAGDIFISKEVQQEIPNAIKEYPEANIISFSYDYKDKIVNTTSNRIHGKLYKRTFLNKYHITFPPNTSFFNEDIGFNRLCRICTEVEEQPIIEIDIPMVKWVREENSITQKDNGDILYKRQTMALSLASIHTIDSCKTQDIDASSEINQIAVALYYWFIRTAAERPQYLPQAWDGARIFYKYYQHEIVPNNLLLGNSKLLACLQYRKKIHFPINILRFAHDIQIYENIPEHYKGGDTNENL